MNALAVVLITRNQAWNLPRLVESVLHGTSALPLRQIVLVDSASSDGTAELATQYPLTVIRLRPEQRLTAAAGRYVGYRHTSGELVLFLDGDMELHPGWLERAVQLLDEHPRVGAVTGLTCDLPRDRNENGNGAGLPPLQRQATGAAHQVPACAGAALYRRSVLEETGSFNPFLFSEEEPELCLRIRRCGYGVVKLDYPIAFHYTDPAEALSTVIARWRRNLYLGIGQNLRYGLRAGTAGRYVRERGYFLAPALAMAGAAAAFLLSAKTGEWRWFGAFMLAVGSVALADAWRKRSWRRAALTLLRRTVAVDGAVRGFLLSPAEPHTYAPRLDVLKP